METRRWTNPSQPQTLQAAVFLLYIWAAINVLFGVVAQGLPELVLTIGAVAAGLGIASERRWGYLLGIAVAALRLVPVLGEVLSEGIVEIFDFGLVMVAIYPVVLLILLGHPQSRDYQRIWFS